jgi:MFS family permease
MSSPTPAPSGWAALKLLSPYQWFVFIVCCLAWDMDCLDQQLFVLARRPAMVDLVPKVADTDPRLPALTEKMSEEAERVGKPAPSVEDVRKSRHDADVAEAAGYATMFFMLGWAVGGIGFGVMGDKVGRVKTLTLTILLYAIFTGLSALSIGVADFHAYRFLTGLGVGGVFAAAVTLLAETMPDAARPLALGLFQASSVLGNCSAALINIGLEYAVYKDSFAGGSLFGFPLTPWRLMFMVGILPGLLVVLVQLKLKEPEKWLKLKAEGKKGGSYGELLGDARWRGRAIFGLLLAIAGVIGLWGIAFFSPDLQRYVSGTIYADEAKQLGLTGAEAGKYVRWQGGLWSGVTSLVQNGGAFFGIFAFSLLTGRIGRRPTFALFFVLAAASTAVVFLFLQTWTDIFWMVPLMGFFQLALFGGYAIYFPELFPTRLRSTGTSFCYNVGRLIAAFGPAALGLLTSTVYAQHPAPEPLRYAGVTMCAIYLLGFVALPFLPETKGKPLPE